MNGGPAPDLPIRDCTIGTLLRRAAALFTDRDAVVDPRRGQRWTFAELDAAADRVAAALAHHGLRPGDRAVLWSANQPDWIALQYGLARAGVVLVTANTSFKREEIAFVLRKSRASALFFGPRARDNDFQATLARLDRVALPSLRVCVGLDGAAMPGSIPFERFLAAATPADRERAAAIDATLSRDDLVNMQYTSGTTGFPKGVMLSHRNLVQNAAALAPGLGFGPGDRLCLCVPLFHCFGCASGTIVAGGSGVALVLVETFDPDDVLDVIERERCTALYGVPTMYRVELEAQRRRPRDLSSLRVGVMAGAPCPESLVRDVSRELPLPGLVVAYGLTEASPGVTLSLPADDLDTRATTIGRVLPGIAVKIVDPATLAEVRCGTPGELWTRGEHVMLGYDDEPEATRAAITPDGWLRTGDLAVEGEDGRFRITGRIKDLIIRGGEKIAPAEVEDVLRRHDAVQDAAVFAIPCPHFGEAVAAAVRLAPGRATTEAELRSFVGARVSRQKVPSRILFVGAFPMTGSGKVQCFKLRELLDQESARGD